MSDTDPWLKIIDGQGKRHRERRQEVVASLGEPAHIRKIKGAPYQYGYFQVEGGVIRLTRWGDELPWLWETRTEFPAGEIEILAGLSQYPIR